MKPLVSMDVGNWGVLGFKYFPLEIFGFAKNPNIVLFM